MFCLMWILLFMQVDFKLMCENAMVYNKQETIYHKAARKLLHSGMKILSQVWNQSFIKFLYSEELVFLVLIRYFVHNIEVKWSFCVSLYYMFVYVSCMKWNEVSHHLLLSNYKELLGRCAKVSRFCCLFARLALVPKPDKRLYSNTC